MLEHVWLSLHFSLDLFYGTKKKKWREWHAAILIFLFPCICMHLHSVVSALQKLNSWDLRNVNSFRFVFHSFWNAIHGLTSPFHHSNDMQFKLYRVRLFSNIFLSVSLSHWSRFSRKYMVLLRKTVHNDRRQIIFEINSTEKNVSLLQFNFSDGRRMKLLLLHFFCFHVQADRWRALNRFIGSNFRILSSVALKLLMGWVCSCDL